jgi:hypothetical protein
MDPNRIVVVRTGLEPAILPKTGCVYPFHHLTIYTPKSPFPTNRETSYNWDLPNQFTYSILPSAAATSTASSVPTDFTLAGRPRLTVPPLAAAFAANSAKRF